MNEALRPSDEQLGEWLSGDVRYPGFHPREHDQYLRGLIGEVLEYRAFKRGEWAGVEV